MSKARDLADFISDSTIETAELADNAVTSAKLDETDSYTVAGLTTTGDITFGDNDKAIFGVGSDLQIYHDGTNSNINDVGSGQLKLSTDGANIQLNKSNTENMLVCTVDGAVTAYYDGSPKLATTSTGIDVTGTAVTDGLTVAGNVSVDGGTIKLDGSYPVGAGNTALGDAALDSVTTGNYNVAIGLNAGTSITTSADNVAIGVGAQEGNGTKNTAVGRAALQTGTGNNNVGIGYLALNANTASNNTAVGYQSLLSNTTGTRNAAVGYQSLDANTTGADNTALGYLALSANTTASYNTAVGRSALAANSTGARNAALGYNAGASITSGADNTAIGYNALDANTTASANTAVGTFALTVNTTGINNTATGYRAGQNTSTGSYNAAFGMDALRENQTGANNTAIGRNALRDNTASNNTAVGDSALLLNTTGVNVAVGKDALLANTTGTSNVAVGRRAGESIVTGNFNTLVGDTAGFNTTGSNNTFIGVNSGNVVSTGSKNTILGRYNGNQGGLDIRTNSNHIVLSDGDGNPRYIIDGNARHKLQAAVNLCAGDVAGIAFNTDSAGVLGLGGVQFSAQDFAAIAVNRKNLDGNLVNFFAQGTVEGNISVSGTTVSYNGGHLSRWSRLADDSKDTSIVKGTVMTNLDAMVEWSHETTYWTEEDELPEGVSVGDVKKESYTEDNEQLNKMAVSSVEGDPNVAGVFVNWDEDDDDFNDMNIAMTGDMVIRIAQGTTVARGDLLMSAGDGTAKPQGDDIVRSKTIAKVTSTHVSHTYDDGSYLVPCVLMAC